eukprot:110215_1
MAYSVEELRIKHNPLLQDYDVPKQKSLLNEKQLELFAKFTSCSLVWNVNYIQAALSIRACIDNHIDVNMLLGYVLNSGFDHHWDVVVELLKHNADVNLISGSNSCSILYGQALYSMWDNVKILLNTYDALGCYYAITDSTDITRNVLYWAAQANQYEIVRLLMDNGAFDHPCWDMFGDGIVETAAQVATRLGFSNIANYINDFDCLQSKRKECISVCLVHVLVTPAIDLVIQYTLWGNDNYAPILKLSQR